MLRIVLFLATNIAVIAVVSIIMAVLGIDSQSTTGLLIMFGLFGMIGSIISLLLSKPIAKRSTKTQLIENPANETERWLVDTVRRLSEKAGIGMPEVGVFPSAQPNAFATGWNKNKALVAVSSGIVTHMSRDELEAVLAHEIGHVANGDMVTLALIQGVVNTFVMFFARIAAGFINQVVFKSEERGGMAYFAIVIVLQIVFGILASVIVAWFSRHREFKADEAGARLASKAGMIGALERLKVTANAPEQMPEQMQAFAIAEGKKEGFNLKSMFASHPPLDVRIAALKNNAY